MAEFVVSSNGLQVLVTCALDTPPMNLAIGSTVALKYAIPRLGLAAGTTGQIIKELAYNVWDVCFESNLKHKVIHHVVIPEMINVG